MLQIAGVFTLMPWLFGFMMLPMAFDAPNSGSALTPYGLVLGFIVYPILIWISYIYTWKLFHGSRLVLAFLCASLPLIMFFTVISSVVF